MIRKIAAHYIFTGVGKPLKQGIIHIGSGGEIVDVVDTCGNLKEESSLEFFDGIITPGFVNTHVHLELSFLHQKIAPKTGLIGFISEISKNRDFYFDEKAIEKADETMYRNGIVAAGDISNTTDSFMVKSKSKIRYKTFVEVFGVQDDIATLKLKLANDVLELLKMYGLDGNISPHAPYSVSTQMWNKLLEISDIKNTTFTIHNQECEAENMLFDDKSGDFIPFLTRFTNDFMLWEKRGDTSLQYCLPFYRHLKRVLLIHNTFTSEQDIDAINEMKNKLVFVLCPNANLYIENRLPNIPMLVKSGVPIALGTDSLASNNQLSILDEMKTIQNNFPELSLEQLLLFATINGAKALGFEKDFGTIEIGKKPGLNYISNIDFREMKLTSQSKIKVLS